MVTRMIGMPALPHSCKSIRLSDLRLGVITGSILNAPGASLACEGGEAVAETRKLAAILVSDVVGYSRLAGSDEDRILARLASASERSD